MLIKPPSLKSKDRIALLAPASRPAKPSALKRAEAVVSAMGFVPVAGAHALDTHGAMAGTDQARLSDLATALEDDSIAAIWFLTGGFGSLHLIPDLPYDTFAKKPKIVLGADDTSHLLFAMHKQAHVVTFYGNNLDRIDSKAAVERMACFFSGRAYGAGSDDIGPDYSAPLFPSMQVKDKVVADFCYSPVAAVKEGRVLAGNLTALVSLFGTRFEPQLAETILLLEDRNERNDILDRWFTTLYISNKLATVAALGLGHFENCGTRKSANMLSFEELVADRVSALNLPTCFNLPFGQSSDCAIVPLGLKASIDTGAGSLRYLESAFAD